MSDRWTQAGVIIAGLSLLVGIATFATPEIRQLIHLDSPDRSASKEPTVSPSTTASSPSLSADSEARSFPPAKTSHSETSHSEITNLISNTDTNYEKLMTSLASGKFKTADEETRKLIFLSAQHQGSRWFDKQSATQIPCVDLHIIDRLWTQHSSGNFGFSIQKQIFQELEKESAKFNSRISWDSPKLTFGLKAPPGHLPAAIYEARSWFGLSSDGNAFRTTRFNSAILPRLDACGF